MYIVQCIDYTGYSARTLCAVCEECSVFAIHYKYIVEGLRKTIRRAKIIIDTRSKGSLIECAMG